LACAKDFTILSVAGWYKWPVESPPIKAGHWGTIPHLESTCNRFNTSARRRTRPSAGPERSQQLQILPSPTVRQSFSGSAYFSCCANIGRGLVFSVRQHFCRRQFFSMRQGFGIRQRFLIRQGFGIRQRFWMHQCFVYISVPIFLCIFLHSY
jgi:hypothetical protein